MNEKKEIKGKENESARTNPKPTFFPIRINPKRTTQRKKGERRGRFGVRRMNFAGAGEEAEPGRGLARLDQGSAAARPLDGGVLTRWGARAPARGPATAQRIGGGCPGRLPVRLRVEKKPKMAFRVWRQLTGVLLNRETSSTVRLKRTIRMNRRTAGPD
jgi:hypothetical protein